MSDQLIEAPQCDPIIGNREIFFFHQKNVKYFIKLLLKKACCLRNHNKIWQRFLDIFIRFSLKVVKCIF
jgi:hypothetical protein